MWTYNQQPPGLRLDPSLGLEPGHEANLQAYGWNLIIRGETEPALLGVYAEDELGLDLTDDEVDDIFAQLLSARRSQQASWVSSEPEPSRLSLAFAALERHNVLARENFSCCLDCASDEILGEFDDSRNWVGAVYYHQQDTENIVESGFTHLAYGVRLPAFFTSREWNDLTGEQQRESYEILTMSMMKQVVIPILLEHGIDVDWGEDIEERPRLSNVTFYAKV